MRITLRVCLSRRLGYEREGISISDSHALCCEAPAKLQLERIADWQRLVTHYTFETVMAAAIGLTTMQHGSSSER